MSDTAAITPAGLPPQAAAPRAWMRAGQERLRARYLRRPEPQRNLAARAALVDELLEKLWREQVDDARLALVGVGGYGRGALFPHSDVDILVLMPDGHVPGAGVERFISSLWDTGLEPGHSVRTVSECVAEAARDVSVDTSLLEARLVAGDAGLLGALEARLRARRNVREFFEAKFREQKARHDRYQEAAYNLEPNIKESPGGLRDLQMVLWLARAAGLGTSWDALAAQELITGREAASIAANERVLQDLRIRLHYLAGRREDRLVFDHQIEIARQLKLKGRGTMAPSDLLMRRYYLAAKAIWRFNQILLSNLFARITPESERKVRKLDEDFVVDNLTLEPRDEGLFEKRPGMILEAFIRLQENRGIVGLGPMALRALSRALPSIGRRFRESRDNRRRFMQVMRGDRLTWTLRRMSRYGVLGRYIPAFGRIVGQMQHDLFHVYTVDEHILMVIRNLRRFTEAQHAHEYPLCSRLIGDFERPEVLYLAALFHDIAKGRGGDHSTLGTRDARRFCREHGLSDEDAQLVGWLVTEHLTMSLTAQKQDVSDPEVVRAFAGKVGDERRLTALYLLTVADIRGTSPTVWNAWKARLLEELFHATRAELAAGRGERTIADSIDARRAEAQRLLRLYAVPEQAEHALWRRLDSTYFQRHTADEIAWHARHLYWRVDARAPVIKARLAREGAGLQVMAYLPDQPELFARICGFFGSAGLSILEARVHTTRHGFALDTFVVHDPANPSATYREAIQYVEYELAARLADPQPLAPPSGGRIPRHLRHFPLSPEIQIFPDDKGTHYILEVVAGDRPGLLARIAYVLAKANVNVASAKINTLGERAEDVFLIEGASLHDEAALLRLETALYDQLAV
jgi:[protein-PII] uridylyltransferase